MMATVAGTGISHAAGSQLSKESSPQDRRAWYLERLSKSKKEVAAISTGVDVLLKVIKEARVSDDKAKMKAALDASQKHLTEMKVHTENCMKHMESMDAEMTKDVQAGGATGEKAP